MGIKRLYKYFKLIFVYFIYSLFSIFIKYASGYEFNSLRYWLLYALALLVLSIFAYLWQRILKQFNLFEAYSLKGTVIILVLLWSVIFFSEKISINNIIGSIIVIIGIYVVNKNVE